MEEALGGPIDWGRVLRFKELQVMTEWGYELMYRCPECSALVEDDQEHSDWHKSLLKGVS